MFGICLDDRSFHDSTRYILNFLKRSLNLTNSYANNNSYHFFKTMLLSGNQKQTILSLPNISEILRKNPGTLYEIHVEFEYNKLNTKPCTNCIIFPRYFLQI